MNSKNNGVPADVLRQIQQAAENNWGDNPDLLGHEISTEVEAYIKLQKSTFSVPPEVKKRIGDVACKECAAWDERLAFVQKETKAFQAIRAIDTQGVSVSTFHKIKEAAKRKFPTNYSYQYEYIETTLRVEPIKKLLQKMESIIGNECYNKNIQNYGPGGIWEGEGRPFRYPVIFDDKDDKYWTVPSDIEADVLIKGRYSFGANELNIFRALVQIIEMLKKEHGFKS